MSDEIKSAEADVAKGIAEFKSVTATLEAGEAKDVGFIKTHIAWIIGGGCFLLGFIIGHYVK